MFVSLHFDRNETVEAFVSYQIETVTRIKTAVFLLLLLFAVAVDLVAVVVSNESPQRTRFKPGTLLYQNM